MVVFAAILGVWVAVDLANENYGLAGLIACAFLWVAAEWAGGPHPDAWMLAATLFGYIVGNRGFAQFSPSSRFPLLPGEVTLAVGGAALVVRRAFERTPIVRRNLLNGALLAWMVFGAVRLPWDLHSFGILALRDFAMVYYAGYFFIGQAMGSHAPSVRALSRALTAAFFALPFVVVALRLDSELVLRLTWHGIPLIFHKPDITAAGLVAMIGWLWSLFERNRNRKWLVLAAVAFPLLATLESPRAAIVALVGVTLFWVGAHRWKLVAFEAGVTAGCLTVAFALFIVGKSEFTQTASYATYERIVSLVDWYGSRSYDNPDSGSVGYNNRFRVVWWQAVATETLEQAPIFGLGFGADLADRFLAEYDRVDAEDFTARSPHSMIMSVFGRMGTLGLALWILVTIGLVRQTLQAFAQRNFEAMGWWSVAWTFWISGCFGVVLEGPMGAVLFWSAAGCANALTTPLEAAP